MEYEIFKTLIRKDHKLGENRYVHGVIAGLRFAICEDGKHNPMGFGEIEEGLIMPTKCTPEMYEQFAKKAEEMYPELCIFYYSDKESN